MKKGDIVTGVVQKVSFPNKGKVKIDKKIENRLENGSDGVSDGISDNSPDFVRVKNVLPGQKVSVRVKKMHHGDPEGMLLDILEKSPAEQEPDCIHFPACGGCTYRTLPYGEQVKLKESQVRDLLEPVLKEGQIAWNDVYEGISTSPLQEGYRNKMEYSFGDEIKDGPLTIGLHKRGSMYDVLPVEGCRIVDEDYRTILKFTREFFSEREIPYYHRVKHTGYLRHLLVRKSKKYGEILVAIVTASKLIRAEDTFEAESQTKYDNPADCFEPEKLMEEYARGLQNLSLQGILTGIVHTVNDSVADAVKDEGSEVLFGRPYIRENILGLEFRISQFSFFQTNSLGAEVLYTRVRDFLLGDLGLKRKEENKEEETERRQEVAENRKEDTERNAGVIYDLYSGTGTIAQLLSPVAKRVVGVEIVEEAVEAAKENAKLNHLENCDFIAGDVLKVLDDLTEKPNYIILDPPRDGIHPKALPKILSYGVERMVYVSCKPTSLARDLVTFMENGYYPQKVCMVDMFPGTPHVETVALIERVRNAKDFVQIGIDAEDYYRIKGEEK